MNIIYEVLSGSHAYGLATETSDEDVRGVFLPTPEELLGFGYPETKEAKPDKVYHSLRKFMHLALKANPSILAWLWVEPRFITVDSWISDELRANRDKFLSKAVRNTFGGYAMSQLKKMEKSYGLDRGYALHGERDATADPYSQKAGYDVKNAQNLVRLLYCGNKLLQTGEYLVFIADEEMREHLQSIRRGGFSFYRILGEAQGMLDQLDYWCEHSSLPDKPDREWAEQFLCKAHLWSVEHGAKKDEQTGA